MLSCILLCCYAASCIAKLVCYAGAIDALMLLDPYIAPGCIVLFDDLVNYPDYREHEIKALWEWLEASKRQVEV